MYDKMSEMPENGHFGPIFFSFSGLASADSGSSQLLSPLVGGSYELPKSLPALDLEALAKARALRRTRAQSPSV